MSFYRFPLHERAFCKLQRLQADGESYRMEGDIFFLMARVVARKSESSGGSIHGYHSGGMIILLKRMEKFK